MLTTRALRIVLDLAIQNKLESRPGMDAEQQDQLDEQEEAIKETELLLSDMRKLLEEGQ